MASSEQQAPATGAMVPRPGPSQGPSPAKRGAADFFCTPQKKKQRKMDDDAPPSRILSPGSSGWTPLNNMSPGTLDDILRGSPLDFTMSPLAFRPARPLPAPPAPAATAAAQPGSPPAGSAAAAAAQLNASPLLWPVGSLAAVASGQGCGQGGAHGVAEFDFELKLPAALAAVPAAPADATGSDFLADLLLNTAHSYRAAETTLAPYSLQRRIDHEKTYKTTADMLMAKRGKLRKNAMVLTYTFPGNMKNELLYSLVEQANKAKGNEMAILRRAPHSDELVVGSKLSAFNRHASNYVVLLPVSPPAGIDACDTDALLDTKRSLCFTDKMAGNIVMLTYKSPSLDNKTVVYAWGVVADRAYANSLDLATRVRVLQDDPLGGAVDNNSMLLPVHLLGAAGGGEAALTLDDYFSCFCSPYSMFTDPEAVANCRAAFVQGLPAWDAASARRQAALPRELRVYVPSMSSALVHQANLLDWDDGVYGFRAQALLAAAAASGPRVDAVLKFAAQHPDNEMELPPTARSAAQPKVVRLGSVLATAAAQARRERFRD